MVSVEAAGNPSARTRVTFEIINNALLYSKQFVEVDRGRELAGLLRSLAPAAARRAKLLHRIEQRTASRSSTRSSRRRSSMPGEL
jgi:hypothetical protein